MTGILPKTIPDQKESKPFGSPASKPDERPVRIPEYATSGQEVDHSTNLANIVAKARKDLENVDKK